MVYKVFNRKSSAMGARSETLAMGNKFAGGAVTGAWSQTLATQDKYDIGNKTFSNQKLVEELNKPILRKFIKQKVQKTVFRVLIQQIYN